MKLTAGVNFINVLCRISRTKFWCQKLQSCAKRFRSKFGCQKRARKMLMKLTPVSRITREQVALWFVQSVSTNYNINSNCFNCLFLSWFWPLLNRAWVFEAAGAVLKIGSNLRPNVTTIRKFSLLKSVKHSVVVWIQVSYRVCHGFRLTKQGNCFWVNFDHFLNWASFLKAGGAVV